ncbi:hypothetical protein OROGR_011917 [Orobanche gracilis]
MGRAGRSSRGRPTGADERRLGFRSFVTAWVGADERRLEEMNDGMNRAPIWSRLELAAVSDGSLEGGNRMLQVAAALLLGTTTKEETCTRALKELIARGYMLDNSCKAGYGSTLKDGLKKKDTRTDIKGKPDIISISIWKRICYIQIQWLSESEVVFELVGDLKTEKDMYGKLATGGGDHVNCLSQEEEQHHPIPPKNKGKKRKSNDGV